jgi:hypothetical protein
LRLGGACRIRRANPALGHCRLARSAFFRTSAIARESNDNRWQRID